MGPSEGLLLRFFRKFYAPFLLHRVTRMVVVSGARGIHGWPCGGWPARGSATPWVFLSVGQERSLGGGGVQSL